MLNRNYGCRYMEFLWNGYKSIIIENELIRIQILVDKGTDIVEFLYKVFDIDLMWRSPIPLYKPYSFVPTAQGKLGNFIDYYPGGWQEIFPNGGGKTIVSTSESDSLIAMRPPRKTSASSTYSFISPSGEKTSI